MNSVLNVNPANPMYNPEQFAERVAIHLSHNKIPDNQSPSNNSPLQPIPQRPVLKRQGNLNVFAIGINHNQQQSNANNGTTRER